MKAKFWDTSAYFLCQKNHGKFMKVPPTKVPWSSHGKTAEALEMKPELAPTLPDRLKFPGVIAGSGLQQTSLMAKSRMMDGISGDSMK